MIADRLLISDLDFVGHNSFNAAESLFFNRYLDDTEGIIQTAYNKISVKRIANVFMIVHGISVESKSGYEGKSSEGGYSLPEKVGGFGLYLGSDIINVTNDFLFRKWAPLGIKNIVMLACSATGGSSKRMGGWGDGKMMLQNIANYTGSTVYASDATEYADGDWEGIIYEFLPYSSGRGREILKPYPAILNRTFSSNNDGM